MSKDLMRFATGVIQKAPQKPSKIIIKDFEAMPKQLHIPANAPPPYEFPKHLLNMGVSESKKPQTVIQQDAREPVTFDMVEDGRVTFPQLVRQGDSAPVAPQKLKTTSKPVIIGDLNTVLVPQQYQNDGRKFAPMTTSEMLMANGHGTIVPDDKDLAQRRDEFDRSKFIGHNPDEVIHCTNNSIAPLRAYDLLGEMRIVSY